MAQDPAQPKSTRKPLISVLARLDDEHGPWAWLRRTLVSIRSMIIVPYLLLTAAIAFFGIFTVANLIASSVEDRFINQLLEAARVAGDGLVRQEASHLEALRPMQGTVGVPEAVLLRDKGALRTLIEVQAFSNNLDSVLVLDTSGTVVMRLDAVRPDNPEVVGSFRMTSGGKFADSPIVAPILAGTSDERGDKFAGLMDLGAGPMLYSSSPILLTTGDAASGRTVGVLLVGTSLERLLARMKAEASADVVIYAEGGVPIGSTFPNWMEPEQFQALQISPELYQSALTTPLDTPLKDLQTAVGNSPLVTLFQRDYRTAYAPMVIRGQNVGVLGVLLPLNFVNSAFASGRDNVIWALSLGIALTLVVGLVIGQRIIQPVMELVRLSKAVAHGDLSQRTNVGGENELGMLASSFNEMTEKLEINTTQLLQENARTFAILNSIADGVLVRDTTGKVIVENPASIRILTDENGGYDPLRLSAFTIPRDQSELISKLDIGTRTISISMANVNLPDGAAIGDVMVLRDITAETIAERTKQSFLNQITHELRTPLTAIKGWSDILKKGMDKIKPGMTERAIDSIFSSSQILTQMIEQIVDLTTLQSGSMVLNWERINLRDLVNRALDDWKYTLKDKKLEPRFSQRTPDVFVECDPRRIRRAIDSLIQNACDFSPEGGALTLTLRAENDRATIAITDPGVGIAPEDMPHIFERFYRGTPRDRNGNLVDVRGMGQGLFVVKSVIEAHQGSVEIHSVPGKGSTVRIYLPLAADKTES